MKPTSKTGDTERIRAYVAEHPGCTRADIIAGCGLVGLNNAMPSYCRKEGLIHASGPRGSQRYYPTAAEAAAAHAWIVADADARRLETQRRSWKVNHERAKARRAERRSEVVARISAEAARRREVKERARKALAGEAFVPRDVRITIAPPLRDRWA